MHGVIVAERRRKDWLFWFVQARWARDYMSTVPTCESSLHSSHGIVWVVCLWEKLFDLILVLRYIFRSHFISSSCSYTQDHCWVLCVYTQFYLINCTFLTIVYWATIYTPAGIVRYNSNNCHTIWCDDMTVMIQEVWIITQKYLLIITMGLLIHVQGHTDTLKWYLEHLLFLCIDLDVNLDCWLVK